MSDPYDLIAMQPKVVIIILNYNGWKDTVECLESLRRIDYDNYEILLLDNGSDDNSLEMIRLYCEGSLGVDPEFHYPSQSTMSIRSVYYPSDRIGDTSYVEFHWTDSANPERLIVIRTGDNRGFAGGNNIAVKFASRYLAPDFILLLNNDTTVDSSFLAELVRTATSNERTGLVQPKLLFSHDLKINNVGIALSPLGYISQRGIGEVDSGQYDGSSESGFFYAAGTCLLIGREFLSRLGDELFDGFLFSYNEDLDLSWIARMLGFRVLVCTGSTCYHKGGRTSSTFGRIKDFWMCRNTIRIFVKNYSCSSVFVILPVVLLRFSILSLLASFRKRDMSSFRILSKSIIWNVMLLKDTLSRRRHVQSIRTVGDREIMKSMDCEDLLR